MEKFSDREKQWNRQERRQGVLILLSFLMYTLFLAGHFSYNANIPSIIEYYGTTRADAGLIGTWFNISCGTVQIIHAIFCKKYSKRYVLSAVFLFSGILNLVLFFRPSFEYIKYIWMFNGICQSAFWSPFILMLSESLSPKNMKRAVLAIGFSTLAGKLLAYGGRALLSGETFHVLFLLTAILLIVVGAVWFFSCNVLTGGNPSDKSKNEKPSVSVSDKKGVSVAFVTFLVVCFILTIPDCFIKEGFSSWMPSILIEQFRLDDRLSLVFTLVLPVFGVLGTWLALIGHRWIRDFRCLLLLFFACMSGCIGGAALSMQKENTVVLLICSGCAVCLANAISTVLVTIMPFDMREQINSGFLTGAMNIGGYLGIAASTYGMGIIADGSGWNTVFLVSFAAAAASTLLSAAVAGFQLIHVRHEKRHPSNP